MRLPPVVALLALCGTLPFNPQQTPTMNYSGNGALLPL